MGKKSSKCIISIVKIKELLLSYKAEKGEEKMSVIEEISNERFEEMKGWEVTKPVMNETTLNFLKNGCSEGEIVAYYLKRFPGTGKGDVKISLAFARKKLV